ncbi:MAG: thiosulfate oxidation carrier protein SoxY [Methyloceanibacter sp.]
MTFGDRAIEAEDGMVAIDAPVTAEDAAIAVRVPPSMTQALKSMTLIIDKNPQPVVATFTFGPAAGNGGERSLSTHVRIDNFSHVRANLETKDGKLHMATKFVQAAGAARRCRPRTPRKTRISAR